MFFKRVHDSHNLYGGEVGASKAAGHEVNGLQLFFNIANGKVEQAIFQPGEKLLRTPLMALLDCGGYRLIVSSLLPLAKNTLSYGSADAGKTVHKDEEIHELMRDACKQLNLKEHFVGEGNGSKSIFGPCDIEVHRGLDHEFYILDTARVMPPSSPDLGIRAAFIPVEKGRPLRNVVWNKNDWVAQAQKLMGGNFSISK